MHLLRYLLDNHPFPCSCISSHFNRTNRVLGSREKMEESISVQGGDLAKVRLVPASANQTNSRTLPFLNLMQSDGFYCRLVKSATVRRI